MTKVNGTIKGIPAVHNVVLPADLTVSQQKDGGSVQNMNLGVVENGGNVTETVTLAITSTVNCTALELKLRHYTTNVESVNSIVLAPGEKAHILPSVQLAVLNVGDNNTPFSFDVVMV